MRILPAGPPIPWPKRLINAAKRSLKPPRTAMEFMEAVVVAEREHRRAAAAILCEAGLQRHPQDFYLLMKRIAQLHGEGIDRGVPDLLTQAADCCPETAATLCNVGEEYAALGQMTLAEDYFRRALSRMPSNPAVREKLAMALVEQDRVDEGITELSAALDADPDNATRRELLVQVLLKGERYQQLVDLLSGIEEPSWEDLMCLSIAHAQLDGNPEMAESLLHPNRVVPAAAD